MKYSHKYALVIFFKKYIQAKETAKNLMGSGNINAYLEQLIESEKSKKQMISLMGENS
jgi:hypothetical protein